MNQHRHINVLRSKRFRRFTALLGTLSVLQVASSGRANAQTGVAPVDWVIDGVGDLIGGGVGAVAAKVAETIFEKVLEFVASLIADAVTKATELLISVFDAVDVQVGPNGTLTGDASSKLHLQMIALGSMLVTLLFLVRLCSALIHNQMGQVAREFFFDLPFTITGTAAAGAIGYLFLQVTNELSSSFSSDFAENIGAFSGQLFTKDALLTGGLFSMLFAVVYILGAVMVGLELIIRASLLTIIFAVAPVMISTRTWEGTRRYSRKFVETALALMFAKPAAAFALALGSAQLADPGAGTDVVKMLVGTTITVMAAFMPFALFKLIPVVEGAAVQQGIKGAPVRVAQTVLGLAASATLVAGGGAAAAAGGRSGAGGSPSGGGGAPGGGSSSPEGNGPSGGADDPGGGGSGGVSAAPLRAGSSPSSSAPSSSPSSGGSIPSRAGQARPSEAVAVSGNLEPELIPSGATGEDATQPSRTSGEVRADPVRPGSVAPSGGPPQPERSPSPPPSPPPPSPSSSAASSASSSGGSPRRAGVRRGLVAARTAADAIPVRPVAYADSFFDDEEEGVRL